jgi:hypothetical protein
MRRQVDQLDTPAGEKGVNVNEKGIGPLRRKRCKGCVDLAAGAGSEGLNFEPDCASSRLRVSQCALGIGTIRVDEHRNASGCGDKLTHKFQPLCSQLSIEEIYSRQVAPGRVRLETRPPFTGSSAKRKTMGIVLVAALAASAPFASVAITATWRRTKSAASSGSRST